MTTLAIIHPTALAAEELRHVLDTRPELWHELRLLALDQDEVGVLTEIRGAAAIVSELADDSLDGVDVAFFFGRPESYADALANKPPATTAVLMAGDGGDPEGRAVVPLLDDEAILDRDETFLSPDPVAVAMAHLLWPLRGFDIRTVAATAIQPTSIFGKAALDELLDQTRDLLSFSPTPEFKRLPATLAFNLLQPLEPTDIARQVRSVLGLEPQMAIQLLYGGIFHGLSLSLQVFLGDDPGSSAVLEALEHHPTLDFAADPQLLGPKDVAGRNEILIGQVQSTGDGGYTLWAVLDNLTVAGAHNAVAILERLTTPIH